MKVAIFAALSCVASIAMLRFAGAGLPTRAPDPNDLNAYDGQMPDLKNAVKMHIEVKKSRLVSGEGPRLRVSITNRTGRALWFGDPDAWKLTCISIAGSAGDVRHGSSPCPRPIGKPVARWSHWSRIGAHQTYVCDANASDGFVGFHAGASRRFPTARIAFHYRWSSPRSRWTNARIV